MSEIEKTLLEFRDNLARKTSRSDIIVSSLASRFNSSLDIYARSLEKKCNVILGRSAIRTLQSANKVFKGDNK